MKKIILEVELEDEVYDHIKKTYVLGDNDFFCNSVEEYIHELISNGIEMSLQEG